MVCWSREPGGGVEELGRVVVWKGIMVLMRRAVVVVAVVVAWCGGLRYEDADGDGDDHFAKLIMLPGVAAGQPRRLRRQRLERHSRCYCYCRRLVGVF